MIQFTYNQAMEAIETIKTSEGTSFWLKESLTKALDRDCVKALKDSEVLTAILRTRVNQIQGRL